MKVIHNKGGNDEQGQADYGKPFIADPFFNRKSSGLSNVF
jgi:hypothetical protein